MNKSAVREAILDKLKTELAQQTAAALLSRDEAINEESRPENQYDMHSQEAAYLAEGQARMAREIAGNIEQYAALAVPDFGSDAAIALGALVQLDNGNWHFVGPRAGGMEVRVDGNDILVITPVSPLGRQLIGKRIGDTVTLPGRGTAQRITAVR